MKYNQNTTGNDYVVGDIHGCFSKLQQCLNELWFNPDKDRLFSVGDLVDRGPESELSLDWIAKPWFHSIRGNHEQMAIDASKGMYDPGTYAMNGGNWFLALTQPERLLFADAFSTLPLWIEVQTDLGNIGLVHGDVPTDWNNISTANENELLWGRMKISNKIDTPVKNILHVYSGHTPLNEIVTLGNHSFIDTGACFKKGKFTIIKIQ
jgi:serine/threonine protein phosphatase 1